MNKKYSITQKILGGLMLGSGVYLAFNAIGLSLIMFSGIVQLLILSAAVLTAIAGSKLFNATTYDFFRTKTTLSLATIVSTFVAPELLINSGRSLVQLSGTIILTSVMIIVSIVLLRLTAKN